MKRKMFLSQLAAAGGLTLLSPNLFALPSPTRRLKILVLGGTNFLGPAIVHHFVERGHEVSLFNRGLTRPELFPHIRKYRGDRTKGEEAYRALLSSGQSWDVVIDVWPENPNYVKDALTSLGKRVQHYIFVSSISVYRNYREPNMDESAPVREADSFEHGNYNANKALCEQEVRAHFPVKFTIVRPGAIVGDRDPGPFGTYMLRRIAGQKEMLAPDSNDPVQIIDSFDIAAFLSHCSESSVYGVFNLTGPENPLGYKEMLTRAREALRSEVKIIWMDPEFLLTEAKLEPFSELPFWIPIALDPEPGFYQISGQKALSNRLRISRFEDTVLRSYHSYSSKRHIPEPGSEEYFGISGERELEIIRKWKSR